MCVSAFQLSVIQPLVEFSKFIFVCEYLLSMTIEIFIPCYFGSIVTQKSEQLSIRLYESNFVDQSKAFRSSMRIFVERSLQPIIPSAAGGILIIGLPTFIAVNNYFKQCIRKCIVTILFSFFYLQILRAAYSLFSLLKTME